MSEDLYYQPSLNRDRLVHIVDPDAATCEALSILFKFEGFQTTCSRDLDMFCSSLDRRRPDVVVASMVIGADSGLSILRRVRAMRSGTPVFLLSEAPQIKLAVAAMKAGASDVVAKPLDTEYLLGAVRDALRKDVHIGAGQGGQRVLEVRGFSRLTPREREVMQLITNGLSNKEAGRELGISPRTVEVHRARVMEKLGARNTADLMRIVLTS